MRSPMIAFSLFAAVGPSLIVAAPHSPRMGSDVATNPADNALNLSHRFVVPRDDSTVALLSALQPGSAPPPPATTPAPATNAPSKAFTKAESPVANDEQPIAAAAHQAPKEPLAPSAAYETPQDPARAPAALSKASGSASGEGGDVVPQR
ncbi:hypothetical protein C2E23DRAFT_583773 [Lenzites betulinus]|nr:hypothetical protein C2E23DRAFT_583773 [Lenzites betulinus]